MSYSKFTYVCGNFWIGFYENSNLFDILYKDVLIHKNISAFSIFEEKILAVKNMDTVYVYLINASAITAEDAVTLIRAENQRGNFELIKFNLNEYLFTVDFNCKITCCGKH